MRIVRPFALGLAALALMPAVARADDAPVSEQIIVRHKTGLDAAERLDIRADSDTELERKMRLADTELVNVTDGSREDALAELRADPDVLWAAPNGTAHALTNDPGFINQWALFNNGSSSRRIDADIDAQQAWALTRGAGVTVGVVDSGVESTHPDLAGRLDLADATDFVDAGAPDDEEGHGTHVAGIVAANRDNATGVSGIAPEAQVIPVRALDENGEGSWADVIDALDWAATKGAEVVNASIGGPYHSSIAAAFDLVYAAHPSTIFVFAAGNENLNNDTSPARSMPCVTSAANVLCVGATDAWDARASYSNYGAASVDIFAPGSYVLSTYIGAAYYYAYGTSMASPYAAGVAALVVASTPKRGAQVVQQLKDTVDRPAGLTGLAVTSGRLNAARAVGEAVDAPSTPVVAGAQGGAANATITMTSRESDVASHRVLNQDGATVATTTSTTAVVTGLAAGSHTFTIVARNTSNMDSPASAPATVTVTTPVPDSPAPAPSTATPTPERPGTATIPTVDPATLSPVADLRLITRGGRRSIVFRVIRSARITVKVSKLQGGRYRTTDSTTLRMAAGLQSLPVTSRLLGMRLPRGRWRVTVGSAAHTATVAFTRR